MFFKKAVGKDVHVVPFRDLRSHKKSRRCWCAPSFTDKYEDRAAADDSRPLVVIHRALDGRPEDTYDHEPQESDGEAWLTN